MAHRLIALVSLFLAAFPAMGQLNSSVYTQPIPPSSRDLDRLNLSLAWRAYVPLDNRGDGINVAQLIDHHLYVQTRTNRLVVLHAVTGEEVWRTTLPKRNLPSFPLAVNKDLVMVVNGPTLYMLERSNGKLKHSVELPSTAAAGLAADIRQCFIVLSSNRVVSVGLQSQDVRLGQIVRQRTEQPDTPTGMSLNIQSASELSTVYNPTPSIAMLPTLRPPFTFFARDATPSLAMLPSLRPPYRSETGNRTPSLQMVANLGQLADLNEINSLDKPKILWELQANRRMEYAPLMFGQNLILAGTDRSVFVCDKYANKVNTIRHEYLSDRHLSAPIAQYGSDLYFCIADGNVYWVNIDDFRNPEIPVKHLKRYLSGMPIDRMPLATDDSVYLAGSQAGLTRLNRKTLEKVWNSPEADRIFAVNSSVVYAGDRRGNLVVLDKARGLKLATLDIHTYTSPFLNDQDDRIYMTAQNGLIACLHDRNVKQPELVRKKEPKRTDEPQVFINKLPEVVKEPEPKKEP